MDINKIMSELGVDHLPPERQEKLLASFLETLRMRLARKMGESLSKEQLAAFDKAVAKGDDAATEELVRLFPNGEQLITEEAEALLQEVKSFIPSEDDSA